MSSITPLNYSILGIQRGMDDLKRDASTIARANIAEEHVDPTASLVHLLEDRLQVSASVKVAKAVDETIGTLLDVKA